MKNKKSPIVMCLTLTAMFALTGCRFFGGDTGGNSDKIQLKIGFWPQSSDKTDVGMYTEWKNKFEEDNPEYLEAQRIKNIAGNNAIRVIAITSKSIITKSVGP